MHKFYPAWAISAAGDSLPQPRGRKSNDMCCETKAGATKLDLTPMMRERFPKLGSLMDDAEHDVLAFMTFPKAHWPQIYSTNPLERLNADIKRRTNVVGIFPNDASITRLVGAMMLEQNDEWSLNRRYMQLEGLQSLCDTAPTRLSAVAR